MTDKLMRIQGMTSAYCEKTIAEALPSTSSPTGRPARRCWTPRRRATTSSLGRDRESRLSSDLHRARPAGREGVHRPGGRPRPRLGPLRAGLRLGRVRRRHHRDGGQRPVALMEAPQELVVIGANAIGLEMGQLFMRLGSRSPSSTSRRGSRPSRCRRSRVRRRPFLQAEGAAVVTGARITSVIASDGRRVVVFEVDGAGRTVSADHVLVATGRRPNTAGLELMKAGIAVTERSAVRVDDSLHTTNPLVWAAGDGTGHPCPRAGPAGQDPARRRGQGRRLGWSAAPATSTRNSVRTATSSRAMRRRRPGRETIG